MLSAKKIKGVLMIISCLFIQNMNAQSLNIKGGVNFSKTSTYYKGVNDSEFGDYDYESLNDGNTTSRYTYSYKMTSLVGWNAGLSYENSFKKRIAIEVGMFVSTKGFRTSESYVEEYFSSVDEKEVDEYAIEERFNYLDIPVVLKFDFFNNEKVRVYGNAGLFVGACASGKSTIREVHTYTGFGNGYEDNFEETKSISISARDFSLNAGLLGGFGVQWNQLYIEGNYNLGVANLSDIDDYMYIRNDISISLGYKIDSLFNKEEK